jgi:hypothetical protein
MNERITKIHMLIGFIFIVVMLTAIVRMDKYNTWDNCRVTKIEGNIVYITGPRDNIFAFATLNPEKYHIYDHLKVKVKTNQTDTVMDDEIIEILSISK